jgi:hypothetical protein
MMWPSLCVVLCVVAASPVAIPFRNTTGGDLGVPILLTSSDDQTSPTIVTSYTSYDEQGVQYLWLQNLDTTSNIMAEQLVAKSGDVIPNTGGQQHFTGFTDLSGSNKRLLFMGEGNGTWGKQNKFMGIYMFYDDRKLLKKVIDTDGHLPTTGERFKELCCGQNVPDGSDVVFAGASAYDGEGVEGIYIWRSKSMVVEVLIDNTIQVLRHISGSTRISLSGDVFFFGDNPLLPLADGIYHFNIMKPKETLSLVVARGQAVPQRKGDPVARRFTAFGSPILAYKSNAVLFTATGTNGLLGIYSINFTDSKDGSITTIMDNIESDVSAFPTDPSADLYGASVFNVITEDAATSGLYYWSGVAGVRPVIIQSLKERNVSNFDTQYNSMDEATVVFYTNDGKRDICWSLKL